MDDPDDGGVLLGRVVGEGHDGRDLHRGQHRGIRTGENLKKTFYLSLEQNASKIFFKKNLKVAI
jgi:hypothetical protein